MKSDNRNQQEGAYLEKNHIFYKGPLSSLITVKYYTINKICLEA